MTENKVLNCAINDSLELNLAFMPFIRDGGLFIGTMEQFDLGDHVKINLTLPGKKEVLEIEGKVVWITPQNALHHVLPGVGVQFIGKNAQTVRAQVEASLDRAIEIGGYTYGITGGGQK